MMESPEAASEMAWPMVMQAVRVDKQLLLLFPLTPFTYHVVADAIGTHRANSNAVVSLCFMIVSSLSRWIGVTHPCASTTPEALTPMASPPSCELQLSDYCFFAS